MDPEEYTGKKDSHGFPGSHDFPESHHEHRCAAYSSYPGAIFLETFLSFVGLGLPLGSCSLGRLISEGFDNCLLHPYKLFPCMVILVLLMIACNLVADGLREAFDTRTVR